MTDMQQQQEADKESHQMSMEPQAPTGLLQRARNSRACAKFLSWLGSGDRPDYDGTDGAHPAWWRGQRDTTVILLRELSARLRGLDPYARQQLPPFDWGEAMKEVTAMRTGKNRAQELHQVSEADRRKIVRAATELLDELDQWEFEPEKGSKAGTVRALALRLRLALRGHSRQDIEP